MVFGLLALTLVVVLWFWKGRDWAVARYPALMPLKIKLDAVYVKWFGASRTLVVSRMTALFGYVLTAFDVVQPILDAVIGSGMVDLGTMFPSAPLLGPGLIALGHVFSYLRQNTDTSVEDNKEQVIAEIEIDKAKAMPVNATDVEVMCPAGCARINADGMVQAVCQTEGTPNA